jgi:hypothetical protein
MYKYFKFIFMKVFLILFLTLVSFSTFSQIDSIEVYITPRFPNYIINKGVFKFKLNRSAIKYPLLYTSYNVDDNNLDSLNELWYVVIKEKITFKNYLDDITPNDSILFERPRIMLINHCNGISDTILIDDNFIVKRNDDLLKLNANGVIFILNLMPLDIRSSWMHNNKRVKTIDLNRILKKTSP